MMIEKYGYTAEVHGVHTKDGYILELHRIPNGRDGKINTRNHPVLIPNCLLGSSADWVLGGPDRSLPMQLADDGFDVWLANYRGNTYSRRHETLSEDNYHFWNFRSNLLWRLSINLLSIISMVIHIQTTSVKMNKNNLSTVLMIEKYGYTAEVHNVQTQDGYILELHRIPESRNGKQHTRNYPVLIPHPILGSSADWVLAGPDRSLPLQLADDGFDVWLANYRGNIYSCKHKTLSNKKYDFWNFSKRNCYRNCSKFDEITVFMKQDILKTSKMQHVAKKGLHELGVFDLPAIIDYILKMTNTDQLHYIGYSMGSTTFFIFASENRKYQEKIRSNISLAPVANIYHSKSSLKFLSKFAKPIDKFCRLITRGKFQPRIKIIEQILISVCKVDFIYKHLCLKIFLFAAFGKDPENFDEELIPLIIGHVPAGTSSKLILHYSQLITTETFGQFSYGTKKNLQYYKSENPPSYKLESIEVPTYLFYAKNDLLTNPEDVMKLQRQLPNIKEVIKVNNETFNHVGFVFSKNVTQQINDPVKDILKQMDSKRAKHMYNKTLTKEIYDPVKKPQQKTDIEKTKDVEIPFALHE